MNKKDYYEVLGVSKTASEDEMLSYLILKNVVSMINLVTQRLKVVLVVSKDLMQKI